MGANSPEQVLHEHINLLMSRLNEQERRWVAALLAMHYRSISFVVLVTGISEKTIRRGMEEMNAGLEERPYERIRVRKVVSEPRRIQGSR